MTMRNNKTLYTVPLAGFANPKYIAASPDDATGIDISDSKSIIMAVSGGATSTIVAEQSLDESGLTGWFPVRGKAVDDIGGALVTAVNASGKAYLFPALGRRMRFRVTALTVADLNGGIGLIKDTLDLPPASAGVAEDAAASGGNPVIIGLEARNTQKASMSGTGDLVRASATMDGKQVVQTDAIPELSWVYAAVAGGIVNSAADVPIKAAAGASVRNYLRHLTVAHDVLGAATELVVKDGATVIWRHKLQTAAFDGAASFRFDPPLRGTANTALNVAAITAVTGGIFVNAQGFTGP